jgi:excisionase family DNA binding protein
MSDMTILLHLAPPIGWIAIEPSELSTAQNRARELMHPAFDAMVTHDRAGARVERLLLTAEEAARVLSLDASWLLKSARENTIPHVRLGKYVRFDPDAIVGRCTKQANLAR